MSLSFLFPFLFYSFVSCQQILRVAYRDTDSTCSGIPTGSVTYDMGSGPTLGCLNFGDENYQYFVGSTNEYAIGIRLGDGVCPPTDPYKIIGFFMRPLGTCVYYGGSYVKETFPAGFFVPNAPYWIDAFNGRGAAIASVLYYDQQCTNSPGNIFGIFGTVENNAAECVNDSSKYGPCTVGPYASSFKRCTSFPNFRTASLGSPTTNAYAWTPYSSREIIVADTVTGFLGCFVDDSTRDMGSWPGMGPAGAGFTINSGREFCKSSGYLYFGLQAQNGWLACSNIFGSKAIYFKAPDSDCGSNQLGSSWRNAVFLTNYHGIYFLLLCLHLF